MLYSPCTSLPAVYAALSSLFLATCNFTITSDMVVFENRIFDFESDVEGWVLWDNDGRNPEAVEYEAFCQRYSLEVRITTLHSLRYLPAGSKVGSLWPTVYHAFI